MNRLLLALILLPFAALGLAPAAASAQTADPDCEVEEQEKRVKYSLYYENYKAEAYDAALSDLEWLLACAPAFGGPSPDDRNLRRAVEVYDSLAVRTPDRRADFLAKAMNVLDTAVPTMQDAGADVDPYYWYIKQGSFLREHPEDFPDRQAEVDDLYLQAIELKPDEVSDYYINYVAGVRAQDALAENTPEAKRGTRIFIEEELMPLADDPSYIEENILSTLISTPREQMDYLVEKYREGGRAALSDEELEQFFTFVSQLGGEYFETPEEASALRRELLPLVAELNPTYGRMMSLARAAQEEGDDGQALSFYERAIELAEEDSQRRDVYYTIATVKQEQGQLAAARNYANQALEIDGNHAESLYLIASSVSRSVGRGDARARAGHWCAADRFNRAASAARAAGKDDLARAAAQAAAQSNRAGPTSDEYFFLGWKPGQTISASYGWGSCRTAVR